MCARRAEATSRSVSEHVKAGLKDKFGGRTPRVRGASKVMAHLMFGIVALTLAVVAPHRLENGEPDLTSPKNRRSLSRGVGCFSHLQALPLPRATSALIPPDLSRPICILQAVAKNQKDSYRPKINNLSDFCNLIQTLLIPL